MSESYVYISGCTIIIQTSGERLAAIVPHVALRENGRLYAITEHVQCLLYAIPSFFQDTFQFRIGKVGARPCHNWSGGRGREYLVGRLSVAPGVVLLLMFRIPLVMVILEEGCGLALGPN